MATREEIALWRERLNEVHNEMESDLGIGWDLVVAKDMHGQPLLMQDVDKRESLRYRRQVVHQLEAAIACLDICSEKVTG